MANPDFRAEAGGDQNGTASATVSFTGLTWQADDIICILVATDGYVPTLSTANGFVIAQDPQGNQASVTTNAGTPSTADCGLFLFWKRATGSTTAADPEPVIAAPVNSGTTWCLETNSYLGARTKGVPWHIITTGIVGTATASVAPPAVTPTLGSVLVMPCAASANDDQAFNAWTLTGAASPSGQIDSGWHSGSGSACAFTAGRGGYASTGGARSGSTTFGATTKQAQFTLVMAAIDEFELDESFAPRFAAPTPVPLGWRLPDDDMPATATVTLDDEVGPPQLRSVLSPQIITWAPADEDMPGATVPVLDEDSRIPATTPQPLVVSSQRVADDDFPGSAIVDEDVLPASMRWIVQPQPPLVLVAPSADEIASTAATIVDDDFGPARQPTALAPAAPLVLPASDELVVVASSGIGGASDQQRSFLAPPQTGTMTTPAPAAAWTVLTAYVVDPSQGGINRVTNGGNLYQCRTGGTSASVGGPSGTGTDITDGTAHWYFVGPAQGTNTASGSQVLVCLMRGNQSQAASVDPTDNDGGTYTVITNNEYASFAGSFAGVWRRSAAANTKTNFTTSSVWGGSGGAGDEMSLGWVELQGVAVGAPHTFAQVERANSSGGSVTGPSITTTKRCLIVSYWFGNGTVQTQGAPDAATPAGGLTLIAGSTGPLSLTTAGYVQHMVAWRKANPGTFAEVWTASPTDEGAQLVTVAYEDLSSPASIAVEDDQPLPVPRVVAFPPLFQLTPAPDELVATVIEDDAALRFALVAPAAQLPVLAAADEVAVAPGDDETTMPAPIVAPQTQLASLRGDDDFSPPALVDDDAALPQLTPAVNAPPVARVDAEELPATAASIIEDDAAPMLTPITLVLRLIALTQGDELPVAAAASVLDEDGVPIQPLAPSPLPPGFPVPIDEALIAAASVLDEDSQIALFLTAAAQASAQLPQSDETVPTALDESVMPVAPPTTPAQVPLRLVAEDEFQGVFVPPPASMIDEDGIAPTLTWPPPVPGLYLMSVDELAIQLVVQSRPKHVRIINGNGPVVIIVNNAPTVIIVEDPNV